MPRKPPKPANIQTPPPETQASASELPAALVEQAEADAAEAAARPVIGTTLGDQLAEYAAQILRLEDEIQDHEDKMALAQIRIDELKRHKVPAVIAQMGVPEAAALVGNRKYRVEIVNKIYGSLGQAPDEEAAVRELEDLGYEGAVLTKLSVQFTEAERKQAESVRKMLEKALKGQRSVGVGREIHSSTYHAFVRRALEDHPNLKAKTLGITIIREAKLTAV